MHLCVRLSEAAPTPPSKRLHSRGAATESRPYRSRHNRYNPAVCRLKPVGTTN
jgi:hypothetical protein